MHKYIRLDFCQHFKQLTINFNHNNLFKHLVQSQYHSIINRLITIGYL